MVEISIYLLYNLKISFDYSNNEQFDYVLILAI